jgi:hypothetical protein
MSEPDYASLVMEFHRAVEELVRVRRDRDVLLAVLIDALFALDGLQSGDFSPSGSVTTSAIGRARAAIAAARQP